MTGARREAAETAAARWRHHRQHCVDCSVASRHRGGALCETGAALRADQAVTSAAAQSAAQIPGQQALDLFGGYDQ